jgi:hypothetical protein
MAQYSRKPIVVEALQWTGTNADEMNTWMATATVPIDVRWSFASDSDHTEFIIGVQTLDGVQTAGDLTVPIDNWVVCNENDLMVTYTDAEFNAIYEVVP